MGERKGVSEEELEQLLKWVEQEYRKYLEVYDRLKEESPQWSIYCAGVVNALWQWKITLEVYLLHLKSLKSRGEESGAHTRRGD